MVEAVSSYQLWVSSHLMLTLIQGLEALFQEVFPEKTYPEYKATSFKILKDGNGISRGVGFARYARDPHVCWRC